MALGQLERKVLGVARAASFRSIVAGRELDGEKRWNFAGSECEVELLGHVFATRCHSYPGRQCDSARIATHRLGSVDAETQELEFRFGRWLWRGHLGQRRRFVGGA